MKFLDNYLKYVFSSFKADEAQKEENWQHLSDSLDGIVFDTLVKDKVADIQSEIPINHSGFAALSSVLDDFNYNPPSSAEIEFDNIISPKLNNIDFDLEVPDFSNFESHIAKKKPNFDELISDKLSLASEMPLGKNWSILEHRLDKSDQGIKYFIKKYKYLEFSALIALFVLFSIQPFSDIGNIFSSKFPLIRSTSTIDEQLQKDITSSLKNKNIPEGITLKKEELVETLNQRTIAFVHEKEGKTKKTLPNIKINHTSKLKNKPADPIANLSIVPEKIKLNKNNNLVLKSKEKKKSSLDIDLDMFVNGDYVITSQDLETAVNNANLYGSGGGFRIGLSISRLQLRTGLAYNTFNPISSPLSNELDLHKELLNVKFVPTYNVLNIPIQLGYKINASNRWQLYSFVGTNIGLVYNDIVEETRQPKSFSRNSSEPVETNSSEFSVQEDAPSNNYLSASFSLGAQYRFSNNWSLFLENSYQHLIFKNSTPSTYPNKSLNLGMSIGIKAKLK